VGIGAENCGRLLKGYVKQFYLNTEGTCPPFLVLMVMLNHLRGIAFIKCILRSDRAGGPIVRHPSRRVQLFCGSDQVITADGYLQMLTENRIDKTRKLVHMREDLLNFRLGLLNRQVGKDGFGKRSALGFLLFSDG